MSIFWSYLQLTLQEYSTYRLNFIFWRLRMFSRLLISLFIWKAVFGSVSTIGGYSTSMMSSYIILIHILGATIFSGRIAEFADRINSGSLSNNLLKPRGLIAELLGRELADKCINVLFVPLEIIVSLYLTGIPYRLVIHFSWMGVILTLAGLILFFLISLAMSLLGFWTTETWALRFFFMILLDFSSGTFIPLDLYPDAIKRVILALPFAQILYLPAQIFLGKLVDSSQAFSISILWIAGIGLLCSTLWKWGLRRYTAEGR